MAATSSTLPGALARQAISTVVENAFSIVSGPTNTWALDFVLDTNSGATAAMLSNPAALSGAVTATCSIERAIPGASTYSLSTAFDVLVVPAFSVGPLVVGSVVRRLNSVFPCSQCSHNGSSTRNSALPSGGFFSSESAQGDAQPESTPKKIRSHHPGSEAGVKPSPPCQDYSCGKCSPAAFGIGRFARRDDTGESIFVARNMALNGNPMRCGGIDPSHHCQKETMPFGDVPTVEITHIRRNSTTERDRNIILCDGRAFQHHSIVDSTVSIVQTREVGQCTLCHAPPSSHCGCPVSPLPPSHSFDFANNCVAMAACAGEFIGASKVLSTPQSLAQVCFNSRRTGIDGAGGVFQAPFQAPWIQSAPMRNRFHVCGFAGERCMRSMGNCDRAGFSNESVLLRHESISSALRDFALKLGRIEARPMEKAMSSMPMSGKWASLDLLDNFHGANECNGAKLVFEEKQQPASSNHHAAQRRDFESGGGRAIGDDVGTSPLFLSIYDQESALGPAQPPIAAQVESQEKTRVDKVTPLLTSGCVTPFSEFLYHEILSNEADLFDAEAGGQEEADGGSIFSSGVDSASDETPLDMIADGTTPGNDAPKETSVLKPIKKRNKRRPKARTEEERMASEARRRERNRMAATRSNLKRKQLSDGLKQGIQLQKEKISVLKIRAAELRAGKFSNSLSNVGGVLRGVLKIFDEEHRFRKMQDSSDSDIDISHFYVSLSLWAANEVMRAQLNRR